MQLTLEKLYWIYIVITDTQIGSSILIKLYDNVKGHDYDNLRLYHACFLKDQKIRANEGKELDFPSQVQFCCFSSPPPPKKRIQARKCLHATPQKM